MSAVACLRVLIKAGPTLAGNTPITVADEVAERFLTRHWGWPRRHARLGQASFLLADPRGAEVEADALRGLAADLEAKLPPTADLRVLMFEGPGEAVMRFATCRPELLAGVTAEAWEPGGRLRRVTAQAVLPVSAAA